MAGLASSSGESSQPGGGSSSPRLNLPSEERLRVATDRAGLSWGPISRFGVCYADTLAEWARRFEAAWDEITHLGFDERFRKLWRFYLSYCEAGFRTARTDVVQLSLIKA